jgi:hypothetical protein
VNLRYLLPRLIRHFLPEGLTRFLLHRGWIIQPGIESRAPGQAVERYRAVLEVHGLTLAGQRVLVFGYGGWFDIGVELLRCGAGHVILCDKLALPDPRHNLALLPVAQEYLFESRGQVIPRPEAMTLFQGDICEAARDHLFAPAGLVLSSSVFEHLPGEELDDIVAALAALTTPDGSQVHFIDLRDHFFKYPFEMLTFSSKTWRRWLNPTSNLNRWRLPEYRRLFGTNFKKVEITILESDPAAFERVRRRIRPEFLVGDEQLQSATLIRLDAFLQA